MTEATSTLWVEMKMRDLVTKPLKSSEKAIAGLGKLGTKTFKAMGRNVRDFSRSSLRQITRFTSSATRKMKSLAKLGALAVGVAAVGFGTSFVKSAIEFEESASKFQAVFKETADSAAEDVRRISQDTGASIVELTRFFGNLQDTFVPMGLATKEAAKLSASLVELGIDVASFQNISTDDVLRDFQSALVGNTETVRKYGIVITQATLKQEAYRLGLTKGNKELTEQAKLQARLSLLFAGTVDAQGDAVRTLDSTANVFRRLSSSYEELKVILGGEIATRILEIISALGGVEGVTNKVAVALGALTGVVNLALGGIEKLASAGDGLFGRFKDTDGIVSLLSGRFSRLKDEAVAAARETERALSDVGIARPLDSLGLADEVAEDFDRIPRELREKLVNKLRAALTFVGQVARHGAFLVGLNIKLGILEGLDGLNIEIPWAKDLDLSFAREIEATNAQITQSLLEVGSGITTLGALYVAATQDVQDASTQIAAVAGRGSEDLLDALKPDAGRVAPLADEYRETGRELGIALGDSFRAATSQAFDNIIPPGVREKVSANIDELREIQFASGRIAQRAILTVMSTPQSFLQYVALGLRQFSAIEEGVIQQMSASTLPSRLDVFFAEQNARIATEVGRDILKGGGEITSDEGFKSFLANVREAREAFFNAGTTASTVFADGIRDAGEAMGTFSQQVGDAATGLVFGLQSSFSTGFETFITSAGNAGDAWDAFRDRFRGTLAQIASDFLAANLTKKVAALFGGSASGKDESAVAAAAATAAAATAVSAQASAAISATQATIAAAAAAQAAALAAKIAASAAFSSIGGAAVAGRGGVLNSPAGTGVQYQAFADGGVTNGPTVALFGERQKEAFVPLPNNGHIPVEIKGGGSGGDVIISIPVNALDPSTAADVIRAQMHLIAGDIAAMIQGNGHRELRVAIQEAR